MMTRDDVLVVQFLFAALYRSAVIDENTVRETHYSLARRIATEENM